ncbi:hypothetical protein F4780DRAFT_789809 [Xylariomycetidae sp. FL0641]|nr:hypothetical protein F4780DRAFT_789809 [Xylariomycetidae sp. FL0641]
MSAVTKHEFELELLLQLPAVEFRANDLPPSHDLHFWTYLTRKIATNRPLGTRIEAVSDNVTAAIDVCLAVLDRSDDNELSKQDFAAAPQRLEGVSPLWEHSPAHADSEDLKWLLNTTLTARGRHRQRMLDQDKQPVSSNLARKVDHVLMVLYASTTQPMDEMILDLECAKELLRKKPKLESKQKALKRGLSAVNAKLNEVRVKLKAASEQAKASGEKLEEKDGTRKQKESRWEPVVSEGRELLSRTGYRPPLEVAVAQLAERLIDDEIPGRTSTIPLLSADRLTELRRDSKFKGCKRGL